MLRLNTVTAIAALAALASTVSIALADDRNADGDSGSTLVEAPTTRVETRQGDTDVQVRAPYTDVDVDTERRSVRVRVPYFNGDIRW